MRNKYERVPEPDHVQTCPGSPVRVCYSPKIDEHGVISLVESGREDIQARIDAQVPQCDISVICSRLAAGDTSMLSSGGQYGDFTELPRTYAEVLQSVIDAERNFNSLPLDVRKDFDHDYRKWLATAGSDSWLSAMSPVLDPVSAPAAGSVSTQTPVPSKVETPAPPKEVNN